MTLTRRALLVWGWGQALIGGLVWLVLLWVLPDDPMGIGRLLLLAPLVLVPPLVALAAWPAAVPIRDRLYAAVMVGYPLAVALLVGAYFLPTGGLAALLAVPWLLLVALIAAAGGWQLAAWRNGTLEEPLIGLAGLYLLVGAGWTVVARAGLTPLGFEEPIVTLTALHGHYAAFAAPVIVALTGRWLLARWPGDRLAYAPLVLAVALAPPFIALGITAAPALELAGVVLQSASLVGLAVLTLLRVVPAVGWPARVPLMLAAVAVSAAMVLALQYGLGQWSGAPEPTIPYMARWHGALNAAFVVLALVGWSYVSPEPRAAESS